MHQKSFSLSPDAPSGFGHWMANMRRNGGATLANPRLPGAYEQGNPRRNGGAPPQGQSGPGDGRATLRAGNLGAFWRFCCGRADDELAPRWRLRNL